MLRLIRSLGLGIAAALMLSACADQTKVASVTGTVTTDLATAETTAQQVITFVGVAEGFASVADVNNPSLKAEVEAAEAKIDPAVAKLKIALVAVDISAPAIEAAALAINTDAVALTNAVAPVIKAVSNKS